MILKAKELKNNVNNKKVNKPVVLKSSDIKYWQLKKQSGGCCGK